MTVNLAFRDTDVGRIPADWDCVRLTEVARLESGHTPSRRNPEYWDGDIPWISLADTDGLSKREIHDTDQTIGPLGLANSSARLLPAGTVVFSRTATIGKVSVMKRKMATSQDFANYLCGARIHNHFLAYLFRAWGPKWKQLMAGSTHNTIYMPVFEKLHVPLPPRAEQEAIAEALSDADALIESLEQLIAKKRLIKQGVMRELLTGKRRLPGFENNLGITRTEAGRIPVDWDCRRLADLVVFLDGRRKPVKEADRARMRGDIPYYGASGVVDYVNDYLFDEPLILLGEDGENIVSRNSRLAFQISGKTWVNNHAHVLRPNDDVNIDYLVEYLESLSYESLNSGTAQPKLNKQACMSIAIAIPSKTEQETIGGVLMDMESEFLALEAQLEKTRQIKQGMMHNLLTGKIRLV